MTGNEIAGSKVSGCKMSSSKLPGHQVKGPEWLSNSSLNLCNGIEKETNELVFPSEEDKGEGVVMTTTERVASVFDFSKWSHFTKVLNIIAWVLRFVNNSKHGSIKFSGPLTYDELSKVKIKIFTCVQRVL